MFFLLGPRARERMMWERVGCLTLSSAARVAGWFKPFIRKRLQAQLKNIRTEMERASGKTTRELRQNRLFFEQRFCNRQNVFQNMLSPFIEPAGIFLDEDVVDFFTETPASLRRHKRILRRLLVERFEKLGMVEAARVSSLPNPNELAAGIRDDRVLARFVEERLIEALDPQLARLLERPSFEASVLHVTRADPLPELPGVGSVKWPGLWRIVGIQNNVPVTTGVLRMLEMSLFLDHVRKRREEGGT